jgi:Family of unknown function (DUF5372)
MFVAVRQTWGEDRVFFVEDDGRLDSVPSGWTDVGEPDVFVAVGRRAQSVPGRRPARVGGVDRAVGPRDPARLDRPVRRIPPHM